MTAERFSFFLKNPDQLIQISYQELKSLVVQYPYCQNLRFLLMAKSQMDNSSEMEKDLHLAATYSADRSHLFNLINGLKRNSNNGDNYILNEDYLELKNLTPTIEEGNNLPVPELAVLGATTAALGIEFSEEKTPPTKEEESSNLLENELERTLEKIEEQEEKISELDKEIVEDHVVTESEEITEVAVETIEPPSEVVEETEEEHFELTSEDENNDSEDETLFAETDEENIPDNSEITYMEKPKQRKSVIDQLLRRAKPIDQENLEKDNLPAEKNVENIINLADELESVPEPKENFMDLSPVKDKPMLGREVLFEITNKTDKEMDAILQKTSEEIPSKEEPQNDNIVSMNNLVEENNQPKPSIPAPKTSFKSYIEQFQPPGMMDDLEEEKELNNILEEAVKEEVEESKPKAKKNKKVKKKKKKTEDKLKKVKSKKKDKKKKSKKKDKIKVVVQKSVEDNADVLSETLAELLGKQGSRKKAIQMYKRLSLIFPKKSSFFADKIEKLKK